MRSRQPKVLHPLCGRPLIAYPLRTARALADRIVLVVGPNADEVVALAGSDVRAVVQRERLGSGHAVQQAQAECGDGTILVLPGDMPLLSVGDDRAPGRPPPEEPRRRDRADRRRRRAAGLRARRAQGGARQRHRRRPRCDPRREEDRRDQHLGVLLRREAPLAGARQGARGQRPGRVLPDGRDRHPGPRRGAGRRGRDPRSRRSGRRERQQAARGGGDGPAPAGSSTG